MSRAVRRSSLLRAVVGAKATMLLLVVVIGSLASIGCGPKTKPTLVRADTAIYEAVKAIHESAIVLGKSGVITPEQELRIQEALLPVAKLGESATRVLAAWKSGPTPPELVQLVREMGALTTRIIEILPGEAKGKAALVERVALAQQAIMAVLVIMGGV